jgi:hypothetical protein
MSVTGASSRAIDSAAVPAAFCSTPGSTRHQPKHGPKRALLSIWATITATSKYHDSMANRPLRWQGSCESGANRGDDVACAPMTNARVLGSKCSESGWRRPEVS